MRVPETSRWECCVAVLNSIELEGVSSEDWKGAAQEALREAAKTLRNIQRMDILGTSAVVDGQGVVEYRTRVRLLFEVDRSRGGVAG
jgi:dodecin